MATKDITATGLRGYFQWLKRDQPAVYAQAVPIIVARYPGVISDYDQSQSMGYLMGLGDDGSDDDILMQSVITPDLQPVDTDALNADISATTAANVPDLSAVANTGASNPSTVAGVNSIVSSVVSALAGSSSQAASINAVNGAQLQQAAAANPPLSTSSQSAGILSGAAGALTSTTGLIIAAGALLVVGLLLSSGGGSSGGGGRTIFLK